MLQAERSLARADQVADLVTSGLDVAAGVLKVASAVPLFGEPCRVAMEILTDVRMVADKVDDVLEAGRRVVDTLKLLEVMSRNLDRLSGQEKADLQALMDELQVMLLDVQSVVRSFGQHGWFKKALQLGKYAKTLKKLDRKIRDAMEQGCVLLGIDPGAQLVNPGAQKCHNNVGWSPAMAGCGCTGLLRTLRQPRHRSSCRRCSRNASTRSRRRWPRR